MSKNGEVGGVGGIGVGGEGGGKWDLEVDEEGWDLEME